MAARSKTVIKTELQRIVAPIRISIDGGDDNPGNLGPVPTSSTPIMIVAMLLLVIIEVLLNIRESEA